MTSITGKKLQWGITGRNNRGGIDGGREEEAERKRGGG